MFLTKERRNAFGGLNDMFGHMQCMDLPLPLSTCFANPSLCWYLSSVSLNDPGLLWAMLMKESVQLFKSLFWGTVPWEGEALVGVLSLFHENSKKAASFRETSPVSQAEELGCDTE